MKSQWKKRADFGRRTSAYVLDAGCALIPALVLLAFFGPEEVGSGGVMVDGRFVPHGPSMRPFTGSMDFVWHMFCAIFVLFGSIEALTGRSLGKYMLGLAVGDQAGRVPEYIILAARAGLKLSPFIFFLLSWITGWGLFDLIGIGLWFLFFTGCFTALSYTRTALHDMVVGTSVYEKSINNICG